MNLFLLKQIAILSAIAGGALGFLSLIPYINIFSSTILIVFLASCVLIYMKKNDLIGIFDIKEGAVFGAVIGFVSFIAASVIYVPLNLIIGFIPKLGAQFFMRYFFNSFGSFIVLCMLIIFIALFSALMNAFAGLVTAYVYEALLGIKKEQNENIEFEIKE